MLADGEKVRVICGDALTVLRTLPAGAFRTCITSPPYFQLRDYCTGTWEGGDDPGCDHRAPGRKPADWSTSGLQRNKKTPELSAGTVALVNHQQEPHYRKVCGKCGARRVDRQIGLEVTPARYVARLVEVFREVKRVLADDGTAWVNLGDSYAAHKVGNTNGGPSSGLKRDAQMARGHRSEESRCRSNANAKTAGLGHTKAVPSGYKPKDLLGIPWAVAFALREDGWYLRSDIIWSKPSPMPESVRDRPTRAHEYLFLLSKKATYYYDAEAIREAGAEPAGRTAPFSDTMGGRALAMGREPSGNEKPGCEWVYSGRHNKRSVWHIASEPCPDAHFATFPSALVAPCVLAGSSDKGQCQACGAPWVRVVERGREKAPPPSGWRESGRRWTGETVRGIGEGVSFHTTGWQPSCTCPAHDPTPDLVLDPFCGSGTVLRVARRYGRRALGIDLSPEYCQLARRKLGDPEALPHPGGLFEGLT